MYFHVDYRMNDILNFKKYDAEAYKIKTYLNTVVGLATFSLALACLSFDNPRVIAMFCTPIIVGLFVSAPRLQSTLESKNVIKFAVTEDDKKLLEQNFYEVTNREPKLKFIISISVYLYSVMFFGLILLTPWFAHWVKAL